MQEAQQLALMQDCRALAARVWVAKVERRDLEVALRIGVRAEELMAFSRVKNFAILVLFELFLCATKLWDQDCISWAVRGIA